MDLLSSVVNRVKAVAQSLGKKVYDDEGIIRQGKIVPLEQAASAVEKYTPYGWGTQLTKGLTKQIAGGVTPYAKIVGGGLIQAPLLAATKGKVNVPIMSDKEWEELYKPIGGLSPKASMALRTLGETGKAGFTVWSLGKFPVTSLAYRSFPAIYGTGSSGGIEKAVAEYAGPSRLISTITKKPEFEQSKLGKTIDTGEMLVGLFLGKGIDDIGISSLKTIFSGRGAQIDKLIQKGQALGIKGISPRVFKIHPEDQETMGLFIEKVKKSGERADLGQLGVDAARLADHYFGKNWAHVSNKRLAKAFEWALDLNNKISKAEAAKLPKVPLMGFAETKAKLKIKPETAELPKIEEKISQFTETVKTSPRLTKEISKEVENAYYKPTTNVQDIANAQNVLDVLGWDKAKSKVLNEPLNSENSMLGQILASKAFKEGRFDEGNEIIKNISLKATKSGQSIQALSVWSKYTPEGMVKFAQSEVEKANNSMPLLNKILGKKGEWTAEDSRFITQQMKRVNSIKDETKRAEATREVFEYISKKLPWGASDLIDEFRYNNLLSNPLTHLRNAVNNLQQTFITRPATLLAEGKPKEVVKYELGVLKSLPDAFDAFRNSLKGKEKFGRLDIVEVGSQLQKPKRLGVYNLPSNAMEAADKFFSTLIAGGEKARGKSTEEAAKTAEYFLFRQDLKPEQQGWLLNRIDDITRAVYQLRKVGLGWFIPFIRTPMNVAKAWIEYSPAGFATTIGASNKREQIAKAILGTVVTAIGADLALQDRVTWSAPTDPLQKKLFYDSGRKPFSVKVGDKWIPMQSFGVFAWALGLPAAVKYYTQESKEALSDDQITKLTKILTSIAGFWSQQTFVSGLASFVRLAEGDVDYSLPKNIGYAASQLKPMEGLMRYVATVIDPVFRKPKTIGQQLVSDIPFLTKQLPAYETTLGEEAKRNITNYIMPYAWGFENKQFEEPYQQRKRQLQENALINKLKDEMEEGTKQVGNKILISTDEGVRVLDLSKITPSDTDTDYQKAIKQKRAFTYVDDILESEMSIEEKGKVLAQLGINSEDAAYYNVARQTNDIKEIWVRDEIGKYGENRQEMLLNLVKLRREVNGQMILADGVIDSLYEDGILNYDEKRWLKNAKYTKEGEVKVKLSGRGRKAKLKSISYKAKKLSFKVPKLKAVKIGGIRKSQKQTRGKIFRVRKVSYK